MDTLLETEAERRLRFYEEMAESQKVEFINGQVILQSPSELRHIEASDRIACLLHPHVVARRLGLVAHGKTARFPDPE